MGQRMFVAVVPPEEVREDLATFLEPRAGLPWIAAQQWHVTLAFMASVPEHRQDELVERLAAAAARVAPFEVRLAGAGAFPDPTRASVLWLGTRESAPGSLERLALGARSAANTSGATPDGKAFVPHVTLARPRRPLEATRWLRVLDTYASPAWHVGDVELVASHLGEGPNRRPRYETIEHLALG